MKLVVFYLLIILVTYIITDEVTNLKTDKTLFFEKLRPNESKIYQVKNLKEGQKYEIRISYPSTNPALFTINILDEKLPKRKLLNIEKETFIADDDELIFEIKVERESISFDKDIIKQYIHYNVIVETLYFSLVSYETMKVIVCILLAIPMTIFVYFKAEQFIDEKEE
eukprot:gene12607-6427_t